MLNKKKVLIFTPGGVGGAERMSVLIGKLLPKERFNVKYVVIGRLKNIYNIMPEGYDVDCVPVRNIYAFSTLRIWWKIIKEKPDLVFVSQAAYNARVIIASKIAGKKVIVRSTNTISKYPQKLLWEIKLTYPKACIIIAQQEQMRQEIISLLNVSPEKVITLHNPIDISDIQRLSNSPSPFTDDNIVRFVNVARINPNKSQDVAIIAFSMVKEIIPNAHLYFVGGYDNQGEYYKYIVSLIEKYKLQDSVHVIGYDKNPFRWVKNADCFVFPSRVEGLPNALIEASYLGVPCAASRCLDIVDDIIIDGRNGYVVNVEDIDGMAGAMLNAVKLGKCNMVYQPATVSDIVNIFDKC